MALALAWASTSSLTSLGAPAGAETLAGDPESGRRLFAQCATCHQIGRRAKNRAGPVLNGLIGAPLGDRGSFGSSLAMVFAGMSGLTWTPENLDRYLTDPRAFMPKTASPFVGVPDPQDRADLIAYIARAGAPGARR